MVNKQIVLVAGNRWNMSNVEIHLLLRVAMNPVLKAGDAGFNNIRIQLLNHMPARTAEFRAFF